MAKLDHNICDVPPTADDGSLSGCCNDLVLLGKMDHWNILYTQRTHTVRDHKGQVSFPGGAWEDQDLCLKETALRETFEEIGIKKEDIQILGSLSPITNDFELFNYTFHRIDFTWPLPFQLEKAEVESVFSIPISWLVDETNREEREFIDNKFE